MKQFVITIGRQLGSGGKEIAEILAKRLNIKVYDKTLLYSRMPTSRKANHTSAAYSAYMEP